MLPVNLNDTDILLDIDECRKYVYLSYMDKFNRFLLGQRMTKELFAYLKKSKVFQPELTVIESDKYTIKDVTVDEYGDDYPERYCVEISIPIQSIGTAYYDNILNDYIEELILKIKEAYERLGIEYKKNQLDILDIDKDWTVNSDSVAVSKKIYFR